MKKYTHHLLSLLFLSFCLTFTMELEKGKQPAKHEESSEIIDKIINNYQKENPLRGVVLVAHKNKITYLKAFGWANEEKNIKNTVDSEFFIGSVTKEITAAATLLLVKRNKIKLHKPIITYLPADSLLWGGSAPDWAYKVTVHHLLTHSSGLSSYLDLPGFMDFYNIIHSTAELIQFVKATTLEFEPGARYEYSGVGYIVLGAIIEAVSGKDYNTFLQENIFNRLGLKHMYAPHTQWSEDALKKDPLISKGYRFNAKDKTITPAGDINISVAFSEAAIISSAVDLYEFTYALYNNKLFPHKWVKMMTTPYFTHSDTTTGIGYGVFIDSSFKLPVFEQDGSSNGYESCVFYNPADKITVIILSNLRFTPVDLLGQEIMKSLIA